MEKTHPLTKKENFLMKVRLWFLTLMMLLISCTPRSPRVTPTPPPEGTPSLEAATVTPKAAASRRVPAPTQTAVSPSPAAASPQGNFSVGVRITTQLTPQQIAFINQHYQVVMTPILSREARESIQGPQLMLYRSIQGTWTDFTQFDWAHIDAHENMFAHHAGERILTRWDSWLMAPGDMVPPASEDARDHWVNYYALTASEQVYSFGYDGLFVDSASHWLNPRAVFGKMPDDYDPDAWYQARVEALTYVKSLLPDKTVVFNGLHNGHGAEDSLENTDGGMWETFAFQPQSGQYQGEEAWEEAIALTARHPDKAIVLVVKEQPGLLEDIQKRTFVTASYLLVSRPNLYFSMTDLQHAGSGSILYFPEYTLDLGAPLGAYTRDDNGLYSRRFERGLVLVNPSASRSLPWTADADYRQVVPVGGGEVMADGGWEGTLEYETLAAGQAVEIPPAGALILVQPGD